MSFIERFSPYIESLRDPREILYIASQANKIYPPLSSNVVFLDLCSSSCGDQDILLATIDLPVLLQLLLLFGGVYHNNNHLSTTKNGGIKCSKF